MVYLHNTLYTILLLVDFLQEVEYLALRVRVPAAVLSAEDRLHTCHVETALQLGRDIVAHILPARAGQDLDGGLGRVDGDDGEVRGGLYHIRIRRDHTQYSIVTGIDGIDEVVLDFHWKKASGLFSLLDKKIHVRLDTLELVLDECLLAGDHLFQSRDIGLRQGKNDLCLERNGIAHIASFPACQPGIQFGDSLAYQAYHLLVGIGTSLVDFKARVSSTQPFQGNPDSCLLVVDNLLVLQGRCDVDTAGRTDDELSPCLRIKIHEDVAVQLASGHFVDTEHTRLLVTCNQCLYSPMLQALVLHDRHDGRNAYTVVSTKRRIVGIYPSVHDMGRDRVGLEVMIAVGSFLRHHVHVRLQQNSLTVLISRCGRLAHDDIAAGIHVCLDTDSCSKVQQELLHLLWMS